MFLSPTAVRSFLQRQRASRPARKPMPPRQTLMQMPPMAHRPKMSPTPLNPFQQPPVKSTHSLAMSRLRSRPSPVLLLASSPNTTTLQTPISPKPTPQQTIQLEPKLSRAKSSTKSTPSIQRTPMVLNQQIPQTWSTPSSPTQTSPTLKLKNKKLRLMRQKQTQSQLPQCLLMMTLSFSMKKMTSCSKTSHAKKLSLRLNRQMRSRILL